MAIGSGPAVLDLRSMCLSHSMRLAAAERRKTRVFLSPVLQEAPQPGAPLVWAWVWLRAVAKPEPTGLPTEVPFS